MAFVGEIDAHIGRTAANFVMFSVWLTRESLSPPYLGGYCAT